MAQEQVNIIRDALIEADPDGQAIYEENAEAFNKELQALHEDFQAALEDAESRVLSYNTKHLDTLRNVIS